MSRKRILVVVSVLGVSLLASAYGWSFVQSDSHLNDPRGADQDLLDERSAVLRTILQRSSYASNERVRAAEHGLGMGKPEVYLFRSFPTFEDENRFSGGGLIGGFAFAYIYTHLTLGDIYPSYPHGGIPAGSRQVSTQPVVRHRDLHGHVSKVASTNFAGKYALHWNPSTRAAGRLSRLHGPLSGGGNFADWAGNVVLPGQTATPMLCTVVSDNQAYGLVNLSEAVSQILNGVTSGLVIADGLTDDHATALVQAF